MSGPFSTELMPIPETAVKDLLSRGFLRLVAGQDGFVPSSDELDFGIDFSLRHVECLEERDRVRYRASGFKIDVQLKATCEREVVIEAGHLVYDLDVTTFNDLVRRAGSEYIPMVLALFVLPDDPLMWLTIEDSALTLRRCTYIWRPATTDVPSPNTATRRIRIPLTNRLELGTLESIRQEFLR